MSDGHSVQFNETERMKPCSTEETGESRNPMSVLPTALSRPCMRCGKAAATLSSEPCNHYECCSKCAMKMATGGRCKTCKNMYTSFMALRPASPSSSALGEQND